MSLPKEIRDKIYELVIFAQADSPLILSDGLFPFAPCSALHTMIISR